MKLGETDVEQLYINNIDLIERLSRFVCHSVRFPPSEVDDFTSHVKLKLFENEYAILRKFEQRCGLASYLSVVIQRLLSEYRIHHFGKKWHSSAAATRLGPLARRLETLLHREHRTMVEALAILRTEGENVTLATLEDLASHLPLRTRRPTLVALEDVGDTLAMQDPSVEASAVNAERLAACRVIADTVRDEMGRLPPDDVTIVRLHFYGGLSVAEIARRMHREQKPLYKHLAGLCQVFRKRLVDVGIDEALASDLIGRAETTFDFGFESEGNPGLRPSLTMNGEEAGETSLP